MQPVIHLDHIEKSYFMGGEALLVLKGISLDIFRNEYVALMGPSGSGKSTLMNILGCLDSPTGGKYILNGQDVSSTSDNALAEVRNKERTERAMEALKKVGLEDRSHHKSNEMSGGQIQRVAIARALINNPSILLADEPTGNLDSKTSREVMEIFDAIQQSGNTVVLVTHEEDIAKYAKRIIKLRDGVIESDKLKDVA